MQYVANNNTQGQAIFPALVDPNLWRSSAQKYGFPMRMYQLRRQCRSALWACLLEQISLGLDQTNWLQYEER